MTSDHIGSAAIRARQMVRSLAAQSRPAASAAASLAGSAGRLAAAGARRAGARIREIDWDTCDVAAGVAAGLAGAAVDILVVRLPEDQSNRHITASPDWSPLTVSLNRLAIDYFDDHQRALEKGAGVPYDADDDNKVDADPRLGLSSKYHRLMAFGHDPAVGWVVGTLNTMCGFGSYADKQGHLRRVVHYVPYGRRRRGPIDALRAQWRHQWSDVFSPAGLPVPFLSLVQLARFPSPFVLPEGNAQRAQGPVPDIGKKRVRTYWSGVARHMYGHGYHSRHFLTMATVPLIVELIARGYWLVTRGLRREDERGWHRMETIVTTGHVVAVAGTVFKTRYVYDHRPTALNAAELMVATVALTGAADRAARRPAERGASLVETVGGDATPDLEPDEAAQRDVVAVLAVDS